MQKSIVKNYLYNVSYQILVLILPLITTPYVSRVLEPEGVGAFTYTNSITQYFILLGAIGLNLYGQREVAYKQADRQQYSKTFYEVAILKAVTLIISLGLFFLMANGYTKYRLIFFIQAIEIVAAIFDISWFFQGLEDFKKIVIRNFIVKIVGVLCIFIFVKSQSDLYLYVFCHSMTIILGNISMWIYVLKLVEKMSWKQLNIKRHLKPALILFIPQISTSLYTLLDKTMIGLLTNSDAEVAFYEQSQKIIKIALMIITSLGTVMMPRIAHIFETENKEKINQYMEVTFRFVFILSLPMMFGLIGISDNFVPWFFGKGYDKVVNNMRFIAPILFLIGLSNVMGMQFLLPTKRQKEFTTSVVVGATINVILNLFLVRVFLSYGAAISTVIAELGVTAVQCYFVRNDFNIKHMLIGNIRYIIYGVVMMILIMLMGSVMEATAITTMLQIVVGGIVYIGLLIITKDDSIDMVKKKIRKNK